MVFISAAVSATASVCRHQCLILTNNTCSAGHGVLLLSGMGGWTVASDIKGREER